MRNSITLEGWWWWLLSESADLKLKWCWHLLWSWSANESQVLWRLTGSWPISARFVTLWFIFLLIWLGFNTILYIWRNFSAKLELKLLYFTFSSKIRKENPRVSSFQECSCINCHWRLSPDWDNFLTRPHLHHSCLL